MQFRDKVYELCRKVPRGRVTTYGELARAAGNSKAARAVGQIMNVNPDAPQTPCHRVVRSDGSVGGYRFGESKKVKRLRSEGIEIKSGRIKNFEKTFYRYE